MIICEVNKNHLNVRTRELLTSGSQNVNTVEFRFNEAWDGLDKTATFKTSKKTISVLLNTNTTAIPWEVLADAGEILAVGVFGVSGETLVLPTVWGILGKVMDAAHLGDEEKEPTPDVYQKILDELNALERPTWDSVQNKPFSTLGSGLVVDENGVLSAQGGGGGSTNAVQYVAQTLTDEQKAQARENIGAGTSSFSGSYNDLTSKPTIPMQVTIDSTLKQSGQAADAKAVGDALQNYVTAEEWENILPQFEQALGTIEQAIGTKLDKNQGTGNAGKILGIGENGIVVPQDKPTYTLPQATADALGGIKADAATAEDTQVVRIGTDGKLRTKPTGGSTVTVDSALSSTSENPVQNKVVTTALAEKITAPTTAAVGQIIKVKSVDGTGKPTEWEAVDMPSGGAYTLPIASPTVHGGVKPIAKTDAMTQGVGVDEAGALWTAAEGGAYKILVNQTLEETASVNIQMTEEMAKCNEYIIHIVSPAGESNVNYNAFTTVAENDRLVNNMRIIDETYGTVHAYHIVKVSTDHVWVDVYSANTNSRTPGIEPIPRTSWANRQRAYRIRNKPGVLYNSNVVLLAGTIIVILGR